jgi:hypothetical protein
MTLQRRGNAARQYVARRDWLAERLDRYEDVPGIHDDVTDLGRALLDTLLAQMTARGFFKRRGQDGTNQRATIRRLVSELRGEHIGSEKTW